MQTCARSSRVVAQRCYHHRCPPLPLASPAPDLLAHPRLRQTDQCAKALTTIALAEGLDMQLGCRLISDEFARHADHPVQILRQQSLATRTLGAHARQVGGECLRAMLSGKVAEFVRFAEVGGSLEVDPNRRAVSSDAREAAAELQRATDQLSGWAAIFVDTLRASAELLPPAMRSLCAHIEQSAEVIGLEPAARTRLVGSAGAVGRSEEEPRGAGRGVARR